VGLLEEGAPAMRTTRIIKETEKLPIRHGGILELKQVNHYFANVDKMEGSWQC
jgi:hypothetical protein